MREANRKTKPIAEEAGKPATAEVFKDLSLRLKTEEIRPKQAGNN